MILQPKHKTILVSVPKAGTYLAAQILQQLGLTDSHLHLRHDDQATGVYDFRGAPMKMSMKEQEQRFIPMPLHEALSMVHSNEFVLGHLPPIPEVKNQLYLDFKIVFLVRDLRDCLISHMRYMISIGGVSAAEHPWCTLQDEQERFKQYLINYADKIGPLVNMKLIACWEYDLRNPYPGMEIHKLHFEDLVSADQSAATAAVDSLSSFLGLAQRDDLDSIIRHVIGAETLTKSGSQTFRDKYWSSFAEEWFTERILDAQGNNVNKLIDYA